MRNHRVLFAGLALALALPSCVVVGAQPATPQRPTFLNNTNTTAQGTLETEVGVDDDFKGDREDADRMATLVAKYGLTDVAEVFVAGVPYLEGQRMGERESGIGDTTLGVRHRFWQNEEGNISLAWQAAVEFGTASKTDGLGNREEDYFGALIASGREEDWGWTAFYQRGSIDPLASDRTGQDAFAVAVDTPVAEAVSGFVEVAYIRTRSLGLHDKFSTIGVAWAQDPALVWDLSWVQPLNSDGREPRLQLGATVNWGPLFGGRDRPRATPN